MRKDAQRPEKIPPVTDDVQVEVLKKKEPVARCRVCQEPFYEKILDPCPYCGQRLLFPT